MIEVAVFIAGLFAKATAGMIAGFVMRKGLSYADEERKHIMENNHEEYIKAHIFENHEQPLKWCYQNQCVSL